MQRVRSLLGEEFSGDLGCPGVARTMDLAILLNPSSILDLAFGKQEVVPGGLPEVIPIRSFVPKNLAEMAVS